MSLLLKALKQTDSRPLAAPLDEPRDVESDTPVVVGEPGNSEELDPATLIAGETALIEPFEPFEATATEFLDADALPDFSGADIPVCRERHGIGRQECLPHVEDFEAPADSSTSAGIDENITSALSRLEELQRLISKDRAEAAAPTEPCPVADVAPPREEPLPPLPLREEYRELRDHLLAKFPIQKPCTLLFVDAGRTTNDASWLSPLAASFVEHFNTKLDRAPKTLIVEAAGPDCGVARELGLECHHSLSDVLNDTVPLATAIAPTEHPRIRLLAGNNEAFNAVHRQRLAQIWPELHGQFDVVLVAAGPLQSSAFEPLQTADQFLPLADGVVLSIELDGTPRPVAEETCRRLVAKGVKLLGCVVHGDAA